MKKDNESINNIYIRFKYCPPKTKYDKLLRILIDLDLKFEITDDVLDLNYDQLKILTAQYFKKLLLLEFDLQYQLYEFETLGHITNDIVELVGKINLDNNEISLLILMFKNYLEHNIDTLEDIFDIVFMIENNQELILYFIKNHRSFVEDNYPDLL